MVERSKSDFTSRLNINSAASDWGLASGQQLPMEEFRRLVQDLIDSVANVAALSDGQLPIKSSTSGVLNPSAMTQGASSIDSTMTLGLRGDSAFNVGGISAVGRASTVSFLDRTRLHNSEPRMFGPVIHETTAGLVSNPFYFSPQDTFTTTAAIAGTGEVFAGTTHQYVIQNINIGTVLEYRDIQRSGGSAEITGANITIRRNSHTDPTPVFDFKRDISGGAGFTLAAGGVTTVIDLTREQLFLQGELLYITITGDGSTPLNLLGETLSVTGAGNQEIPHIDNYGRLGAIVFTENALGSPASDNEVLISSTGDVRSWTDVNDLPIPFKNSARVVSRSNIALSGLQTIEGVTLSGGDRVLVAGQTDASENGLYDASSNAWSRSSDADTSTKMRAGIYIPVSEGAQDADTLWFLATNDPITLDTTALVFREQSGVMTTFNAPQITAFSVSGLTDPTPPVGTNLGGTRTVTFTVTNQGNIQDTLTFSLDGSPLLTTIDPAAGTAEVTIPTTNTVAGTTYTMTLSGTNTQGAAFNSSLTFRSAQSGEEAYYGVRATNDFASVDVANLTAVDVTASGTTYTISESAPNTQILGILSPSNRDPVSIIDTVLSLESLSDFTATSSVRTIGAQTYNLLTLTNNSGFTGTFNYTVTTE